MFSRIARWAHDAKATGAGISMLALGGLFGLVWLSVGVERLLAPEIGPAPAALFVAVLFLLPTAVFAATWKRKQEEKAQAVEVIEAAKPDPLLQVARAAGAIADRAPIATLATVAAIGILAARFPKALHTAVDIVGRVRRI